MTDSGKSISDFFSEGRLSVESLDCLPFDIATLPQGWMAPLELQVLYNFAKYGSGDFLEIGTWVGRSTVAIAHGMKSSFDKTRKLDVNDFGFVSLEDASRALNAPISYFTEADARPIHAVGGSIAVLIENLRSRGLIDQVTSVIRGNAAHVPFRSEYGVVFCDAVHNKSEIDLVGPALSRVLKSGSWLICDDIHDKDELVDALRAYIQFDALIKLCEFGEENKAAVFRII